MPCTCSVLPGKTLSGEQELSVVEGRELLPSFDNDMFEYRELPGFSLVAFACQLDYFSEIFQFDRLHPVVTEGVGAHARWKIRSWGKTCKPSLRVFKCMHQDVFRQQFRSTDTVLLESYPGLMPYLLNMDRAQVLAWGADNQFHLAGVFASFPSDIDSELKRSVYA